MKTQALIVFDMDGVLIDVSGSYRDTVRQTARLFLKRADGFENLPDPLFSLSDLAAVKQSGGLNNDWDLTVVILNLLFTRVKCPKVYADPDPWVRYGETIKQCDVSALARFLQSTDMPVASLLEKNGRPRHDFVTGLYTGDVGSGNIIKQIFQEIYLGIDLFRSTYGFAPKVYRDEGFINRESLLVDRSVLQSLARIHTLAIATGRPRAEAKYPLERFGIGNLFTVMLTLDDCLEEEQRIEQETGQTVSLSKPDPWMLDAVAGTIGENFSRSYYVGDMPDDMFAASRSKTGFTAVGTVLAAPDRENLKQELLRAGADYIIEDLQKLPEIVG